MSGTELAWPLAQQGCWAAVATLGFSVLFNVPKYALPYCALIGALAYVVRAGLMNGGIGIVLATLPAALVIGVLATALAQRFAVSGVLFFRQPGDPAGARQLRLQSGDGPGDGGGFAPLGTQWRPAAGGVR
jgi:hypothetical protein